MTDKYRIVSDIVFLFRSSGLRPARHNYCDGDDVNRPTCACAVGVGWVVNGMPDHVGPLWMFMEKYHVSQEFVRGVIVGFDGDPYKPRYDKDGYEVGRKVWEEMNALAMRAGEEKK